MALTCDVLVIGSGLAGLSLALKAARYGSVLVITKKEQAESNTQYAQGGIAAVFGASDSFAAHERDTMRCGAGLSVREVVRQVVREGPERVRELAAWGVPFSRAARGFALGREGGHTRRRIVHAADLTGRAVEQAMLERVRNDPRIRVIEDRLAVDLLPAGAAAARTPAGAPTCSSAAAAESSRSPPR